MTVLQNQSICRQRTPGETLSNKTKIPKLFENMPGKFPHQTFFTNTTLRFSQDQICQNVRYFCRINTHHIQPAALPTTINNAINEHNDDSTRRTILFAHHAFRTARYYKWPNTPYNSTSFSRCPSLAWLPTYSNAGHQNLCDRAH